MKTHILTLIVCLFSLSSFAQSQTYESKGFRFEVSKPFVISGKDLKSDVILELKYQKDMLVLVQNNFENVISDSPKEDLYVDMAFDVKFLKLQTAYRGMNPQEKQVITISENSKYVYKSFHLKAGSAEAFCEYGLLQIGDRFLDFVVTGDRTKEKELVQAVHEFVKKVELIEK